METKKATISRADSTATLELHVEQTPWKIILTDDNPINIKSVFNRLLKAIKKGEIEFELDDPNKNDLYHDICAEYLVQLNAEIKAIYKELMDYGLASLQHEE